VKDPRKLAAIFRDAGVRLSRRGGTLAVGGPAKVLTPEVLSLLAEHKAELLDMLGPEAPAAAAPDVGLGAFGTADVAIRRTETCLACGLPRFGPACVHCAGKGPWRWPWIPPVRSPAEAEEGGAR